MAVNIRDLYGTRVLRKEKGACPICNNIHMICYIKALRIGYDDCCIDKTYGYCDVIKEYFNVANM